MALLHVLIHPTNFHHPILIIIHQKHKPLTHNLLPLHLILEPVQVSLVAELALHHGLLEYVAHRDAEQVRILSCHIPVTSKGAERDEGRGGECSILSIQYVWGVVHYLPYVGSVWEKLNIKEDF